MDKTMGKQYYEKNDNIVSQRVEFKPVDIGERYENIKQENEKLKEVVRKARCVLYNISEAWDILNEALKESEGGG